MLKDALYTIRTMRPFIGLRPDVATETLGNTVHLKNLIDFENIEIPVERFWENILNNVGKLINFVEMLKSHSLNLANDFCTILSAARPSP